MVGVGDEAHCHTWAVHMYERALADQRKLFHTAREVASTQSGTFEGWIGRTMQVHERVMGRIRKEPGRETLFCYKQTTMRTHADTASMPC